MCRLGTYYESIGDYDNMLKYYLYSIEHDNSNAMYYLGKYYENIEDYDNMKKYYTMALDSNDNKANREIERIKKIISQIPNDTVIKTDNVEYKNELVSRMTCCICMINERNIFFNCGHSTCSKCSLKIDICGECKTGIKTRNKLFY
jgi:tetratricopeptide (TPR) repeat protein